MLITPSSLWRNDLYCFHPQVYWRQQSLLRDATRWACSRLQVLVVKTASTSTSGFLKADKVAFCCCFVLNGPIIDNILLKMLLFFTQSVIKSPRHDLVVWRRLPGRWFYGAKFSQQLSVQRSGNFRQGRCYCGVCGIPCGNPGLPQYRGLSLTW